MGRPRKFKQPRNQTVTFETAELQIIREEAQRRGVSISAYIRGLSLLGMAMVWGKRRLDEGAPDEPTTVKRPDASGLAQPTGRRPSRPDR